MYHPDVYDVYFTNCNVLSAAEKQQQQCDGKQKTTTGKRNRIHRSTISSPPSSSHHHHRIHSIDTLKHDTNRLFKRFFSLKIVK